MIGPIDGPETRTMPMPPRPGAVAIATIGSAAAVLTIEHEFTFAALGAK